MTSVLTPDFLARFKCLGSECEDMCCRGWSMQLDDATFGKYRAQAPELLEAVVEEEGAGRVMRRDPATSTCVKLEAGWCGVQKKYGEGMLGDACHFYPRVTRSLGAQPTMTASLSCPEIARLALLNDAPLDFSIPTEIDRLPTSLRDYLPAGLSPEQALSVHAAFLNAANDAAASPEQIMMRLGSVSRSLSSLEPSTWAEAVKVFLMLADGRIPPASSVPENPFNLLHCLSGLIIASHKAPSVRLGSIIKSVEAALACHLDWDNAGIATSDQSLPHYLALRDKWNTLQAEIFAPLLRRWIAMQVSVNLFPFAGAGSTLAERITIIGVRYSMLKLALMCMAGELGREPGELFIFTAQTLSRFLDHLGEPGFLLAVCEETGWLREEKMRGLLEG